MESHFFKDVGPKKASLDDDKLFDDEGPAGPIPLVILFGFLPGIVQNILKLGIDFILKVIQLFGKALEEAMRDPAKDKLKEKTPSMSPGWEGYSTHASFDHLRRIDRLEDEMHKRSGGYRNKMFAEQVEHRIKKLEKEMGIIPRVQH